jgi:diketogulonate reductase-like aldo/keto reductase
MNLPPLGFGCSPYRAGGRRVDLEGPVRAALAAGYRLFDLAELYGNERSVGRALRGGKGLFLVGKVWRTNFRPEVLRQACESSLRRLGVDAFDLYLLHAPEAVKHLGPLDGDLKWEEFQRRALSAEPDDVPLRETWEAMRELEQRGLVQAVGVSNFAPRQIEALGSGLPAASQIESSPYRPHEDLAGWCRERGIALMAHSPLSAPGLLGEPVLAELALRHGCLPAAVALRWNVQRGLVPLPSSTDPGHIVENLRALEIELGADEMALVDGLRGAVGR